MVLDRTDQGIYPDFGEEITIERPFTNLSSHRLLDVRVMGTR